MTGHYRTRISRVTGVRVPPTAEIAPGREPTRAEIADAAEPLLRLLGQGVLRSEHATVRVEGRVLVTVHQRPGRVYSAGPGDWLIRDEYGVYTTADDRTFRAFYEPSTPPLGEDEVVVARAILSTIVDDMNAALRAVGYEVTFDLSPVPDRQEALRAAIEAERDRDLEPEPPADPTGVDCAERYEGAAEQG